MNLRKLLRALVVLGASLLYLGRVFRLGEGQFGASGLGDWMDPYFINGLLEHWSHSVRTLADPASPPMFFPTPHVLGYSHGLVLYAPFYVPLRVFLHPFQAYNATLFLVLEAGSVCLYLLLRRWGLSFVEALVLAAFFCGSENVMNGTTGVWTQRASVFLIPPILLLADVSLRTRSPRARIVLAFTAGLLAALMYVQDFYTAHFAAFFVVVSAGAALFANLKPGAVSRLADRWRRQPRRQRAALAVAGVAALVAGYIFMYGGGATRIMGIRLAARDWTRPALVAVLALGFVAWRDRAVRDGLVRLAARPWRVAFLSGAFTGAAVFLWIYLGAFRQHPGFAKEEIWTQLVERNAYPSLRTFAFVAAVAILAWVPSLRVQPRERRGIVWLVAASAFVLLVPLRFGEFSLWTAVIARLPGFSAIRDPKRIIYLYELAVVLACAGILARAGTAYRASAILCALFLLALAPNRERFDYERPNVSFDRWVAAPIAIDPACRSFYLKGASAEYMSRSSNMGTLYGNDAAFVALDHSIPTLNGYSAWYPKGWELWNPQESTYQGRVQQWIDARQLTAVCELDIDARTMRPRPGR